MRRVSWSLGWPVLATVCLLSSGCGDDDSGGGDTETDSGSTGASTSNGSETSTSSGTDPSTSSGSTTDPTTTTATSTTDPTATGTDGGTAGSTGESLDCDDIPAAPFSATPVFTSFEFDGSEDLAFDGAGNVVAYVDTGGNEGDVVAVSADGQTTDTIASGVPPIYGIRYLANGDLIAAAFTQARVIEISTGTVLDYVTGVSGINGLQPDADGRVWATNFGQVLLIDTTPSSTAVVDPASSSNGIVYDPDRGYIFYTDYNAGTIHQATVDTEGTVGAGAFLADLGITTRPDGMALDACGNLYVVDQAGEMIYRVFLDDQAALVGQPEALLDGQTGANIANAQFGSGSGWSESTLYAIGTPGILYAVDVGVPGAPYPTP